MSYANQVGIYIPDINYNSIIGCVSTCDHPDCHKIAEKHYFKGDEHFWEMFEKSYYPKTPFYESYVLILGFCPEHAFESDSKRTVQP